MANRRMFSKSITDSDSFLDMPHSTQVLYFQLGMHADDDGFLDNYNSVMRQAGCKIDDLKLLLVKGYLLPFENGVIVITHWRQNNQLRKDRYTPTIHQVERKLLTCSKSGVYSLATNGIPNGNQMATQYSIGKYSIVKDSIEECVLPADETQETHTGAQQHTSFVPPTLEQVQAFCKERNSPVNADKFFYFNQARNWNDVWDWKGLLCYWETLPQYSPAETDADNWLETLANIGKGDCQQ